MVRERLLVGEAPAPNVRGIEGFVAWRGVPWVAPPAHQPRGARALSSTEQFTHACAQCRKLITLQLEAREQLRDALALSPGSPAIAALRGKVDRLQADCEVQFMKAMSGLPVSR